MKIKFRKKKYKIKPRGIYAVMAGQHVGEFFVFMGKTGDQHDVISMGGPGMQTVLRQISEKDVKEGFENKILELVEVLPKDIYNTCEAEFHHRKAQKNEFTN